MTLFLFISILPGNKVGICVLFASLNSETAFQLFNYADVYELGQKNLIEMTNPLTSCPATINIISRIYFNKRRYVLGVLAENYFSTSDGETFGDECLCHKELKTGFRILIA